MPLPVVPDVYQVRLLWTGSPLQRTASINLHFHDNVGTQTAANLFTDLDASVLAGMWNLVSSNAGVTGTAITPLDGTSASTVNVITGFPAKWTGGGGTEAILQGAAVVSVKSALRARTWRNRLYLPAIAESKQLDGTLDATTVGLAQTAWNSFRTSMIAAGWEPAVVSPKEDDWQPATAYVVRPFLKSQRRRARR